VNILASKTGPFVADGYVVSNTTERQIFSSTGALYHQGVILPNTTLLNVLASVTWPTTGAQTLVNTTGIQALTNKTINNITITDPGTAATLTVTSGGTLEAIGAFQHKFTAAANSAVTIPSATDATLMWTTELDGKITAKTSQINPLGVATWPSTAAHTLVSTTDTQTLSGKTIVNAIETLTASSGGVTPSTMTAYGIARVNVAVGDPSTSPLLASLAAPIAGVEKTIIFATTVAYVNTLDVDLGIGVGVAHLTNTTDARFIGFSTLATEWQAVTLIGLSTALWGVKSVDSTVGGFGTAAGIRSLTAARTS